MTDNLSSTFFAGNRTRLHQIIDNDCPIVVTANGQLQRSGDSTFLFRQDSNFYYLTGINDPDAVLVLTDSDEYIIVPGRSTTRESFDGAIDIKKLSKRSGIKNILDAKQGWAQLKSTLQNSAKVATLAAAPSYLGQYGFYTNPARARLIKKLKTCSAKLDIIDIREQLVCLRVVKQPPELRLIQQAIDITSNGIRAVQSNILAYKYEYEIEADLTRSFRAQGASGHAFEPIVAAGKNACTLHNISNNNRLPDNTLVVMDVGAEVANYAADITRTIAFGKPTARQRAVFDAVLETQNYALTLLKPGILTKDYEGQVVQFLGKKLQALKLITKITNAAVRQYYPHATGHSMGLDVHDVADYSQPLTENMVITCEPGIYIPEEGIGVRIEDDVLITKNGNRVLSGDLERRLY